MKAKASIKVMMSIAKMVEFSGIPIQYWADEWDITLLTDHPYLKFQIYNANPLQQVPIEFDE